MFKSCAFQPHTCVLTQYVLFSEREKTKEHIAALCTPVHTLVAQKEENVKFLHLPVGGPEGSFAHRLSAAIV